MIIITQSSCGWLFAGLVIALCSLLYFTFSNFALVVFLASYLIPIIGGCGLCFVVKNVCQVTFGKYFYHNKHRHANEL